MTNEKDWRDGLTPEAVKEIEQDLEQLKKEGVSRAERRRYLKRMVKLADRRTS